MPPHVAQKIDGEINFVKSKVRWGGSRFDVPFILSKVDVSGFNLFGMKYPDALSLLNNIPIKKSEWDEIVDFYRDLNSAGFHHTDIINNLHMRRTPKGKLKITLLDFEDFQVPDVLSLQEVELNLISNKLGDKNIANKYLR